MLARNSDANASVNVLDMRAQTRFGVDEIEGLLEKMLEVGWVARLTLDTPNRKPTKWWRKHDAGAERWILIMNPAALCLATCIDFLSLIPRQILRSLSKFIV